MGSVRHNLETVTTCHTRHADPASHKTRGPCVTPVVTQVSSDLTVITREEKLLDICLFTVHLSLTFYADDVFAYLLR